MGRALPQPRNEYERLLNAARLTYQEGRTRDFQLSDTAVRIAKEQGLHWQEARTHFLAVAILEHVKGIHWDAPPDWLTS